MKTSKATGLKRSSRAKSKSSKWEALFDLQAKALGIELVREYRFHPTRKWRFDFAMVDKKIAIEIEGGIYTNGRHTRANGFEADCEKYNHAVLLGWHVLRFTSKQIARGEALSIISEFLSKH